jgi:CBS domain-containing protein
MSSEFEYVQPDESLGNILKKMNDSDLHEIIVSADGKKLEGVVSYKTLLKRKNLSIATKASSISIVPQEITPETVVTELADAFLKTGHRQIPVVMGKTIKGIVSRNDLLKMLAGIKELRDTPLSDVMNKEVKTVNGDDTVETAVQLMKNLNIRALPVLDELGRLYGVIGMKDIALYNWHMKNKATVGELIGEIYPSEVVVSSAMVEAVVTATPSSTLGEAAKVMLDRKISSLPVVDDGKMVGIVTKYDVVELMASFRKRDIVYTQITGLGDDDRFALDQMDKQIASSLQKIAKITLPMMFTMHVTRYNTQGGNNYKYSLNARLFTEHKVWMASAVEWDLIKATDTLMGHFERRIIERKEENIEQRKHSRDIGHD